MLLALSGVALADLTGVDVPALRPSDPNQICPIEVPGRIGSPSDRRGGSPTGCPRSVLIGASAVA